MLPGRCAVLALRRGRLQSRPLLNTPTDPPRLEVEKVEEASEIVGVNRGFMWYPEDADDA